MADSITHEYDGWGGHRLKVNNSVGEWAGYHNPAEHGGYMAFTDYYGERVVQIKDIGQLDYSIKEVSSVEA